jgi:hypothetical protein
LANVVIACIDTIATKVKSIGTLFVAKRVLFCRADIETGVDTIATIVPAALHAVAKVKVSGLDKTCAN